MPPQAPTRGLERRQWVRNKVCVDVQLHAPTLKFVLHSKTVDMSSAAVFVRTTRALPVGTKVNLEFQRGREQNPLRLKGEVVRTGMPEDGRSSGVAVRFLQVGRLEALLLGDMLTTGRA